MSDLLIVGGVVIVLPVERTGELGKFIAKTRVISRQNAIFYTAR